MTTPSENSKTLQILIQTKGTFQVQRVTLKLQPGKNSMYAHFETIIDFLPNGQLQLPELVKPVLQTPQVRVTITANQVRLEPVRELAGCLRPYAPAFIPTEQARAMAWSEVVDEKHRSD